MLKKNVETFLGCDSDWRDARVVLFGAPFDSTTSFRPGARFASAAMRKESYGLETYSPYQDKDLADCKIFDSGDLELSFGSPAAALSDVERRAKHILKDGKIPFLIGGEHLVTLGAVRAASGAYPDLHIVHFDAHADLRGEYLGAKLRTRASCAAVTNFWATAEFSVRYPFGRQVGIYLGQRTRADAPVRFRRVGTDIGRPRG